jgi:hypothetical protein
MISWTVAYRSGGEYNLDDVDKLRVNLKKFYPTINYVVFSDDPETAKYCDEYWPLITDWSTTWFSIIECFRYNKAPTLFSGLDTILMKPIPYLIERVFKMRENEFMMMTPFNERFKARGWFASGVQAWNGDFSFIFNKFDKRAEYYKVSTPMEEEFTTKALKNEGIEILRADHYASIKSYKKHYAGLMDDGKNLVPVDSIDILCFHGLPRPSQIDDRYLQSFRKE